MTVSVAIDLALDKFFTYEVPEGLKEKLAVGQLLCVPFGHRMARGFAMQISESNEPAQNIKLKSVESIVDEVPFFTPSLLEVVKRISAYVASPVESVLRAALPAAVLKKNAKARELMFVEPSLAPQLAALTKRQQWLYDQIVRLGGGWMTQLLKNVAQTQKNLLLNVMSKLN